MINKNLSDPESISPEQEAREDFDDRNAADDLLRYNFYQVFNVSLDCSYKVEDCIYKIYHSSNNDELLAVNDLKSILFNSALELVKRRK